VQREVVGVVADVRDWQVGTAPVPEVFIPHAQSPLNGMGIVVRIGEMGADAVLPSIRQSLARLDPGVAMVRPRMMDALVAQSTGSTRMTSILTSVFALVAALLASVGIFSLIAISVAQRTREIGIRVALGADRRAVVGMVVGEGMKLAAMGIAAGVAGAVLLTRALQTFLYEVSPTDPVVLAGTCAGVLAVAIVASLVPALRALRVDPVVALRAE
jgi:putative ABC transport system permease protein